MKIIIAVFCMLFLVLSPLSAQVIGGDPGNGMGYNKVSVPVMA